MEKVSWGRIKNSNIKGVKVKDYLEDRCFRLPHSNCTVTDYDKAKLKYLLDDDFGGLLQVPENLRYEYILDLHTRLTYVMGKLRDRLDGKPTFKVKFVIEGDKGYQEVLDTKEKLVGLVNRFVGFEIDLGGYLGLTNYTYYFESPFYKFLHSKGWFYDFKVIELKDFLMSMSCHLDYLLFDEGYCNDGCVADKVYVLDEELNRLVCKLDDKFDRFKEVYKNVC
jgi:hypothetical protein